MTQTEGYASYPGLDVVAVAVCGVGIAAAAVANAFDHPLAAILLFMAGVIAARSPRQLKEWERCVVLRLGRFRRLGGPGVVWLTPFVDTLVVVVDQRTITTTFSAERTLTADAVPVNVDAVLFWVVHDSAKAALEVQDFPAAVSLAAQTALRDVIGRTGLIDVLRGRERIEEELQRLIDERSNPWGITVQSVEMRDIVIPEALQSAMSKEAQASRDRQARMVLAQAEVEISRLFATAASAYRDNPTAFQLRAMNLLVEAVKDKGTLVLVPTALTEGMSAGFVMGAAIKEAQGLSTVEQEAGRACR